MSIAASTSTSFEDNNDDLLRLLTGSWDTPLKDTIETSKWTRDYLTKLTSLPLDSLLHEPTELREEQAKAKRDAQQLAFRDYPCFLHAQTCRHQVEETLDGLDVHLGEFLSSVPELQEACEIFSQQAKEIKEERGKITRVLEHQNVLTDLLEIPQLMETCVWNGYYSEAMDLASHVRLLQVRYPLPTVKSIHQQVQSSSDLMLVQLISHLRKPIRLAAAMNVVGFLRRMDVFDSETELRMVFLRCRHDFLQQRLARIKRDVSEESRQRSSDAFEYLKKFIDVMREQMFEIGTQYISIFSNEQGTLLSDYMVHVIGLIKAALDTYLPMIEDTSALTSLLTQLQYCGMSLGRIGLDFRHIFVHSFEEAVQPMILRWIDSATEDLVQKITKASHESTAPSAWMSSKATSQSSSSNENRDEAKRHAFQPPMLLVSYPSLAIFTNGVLSAFNALRLLPAISLYIPVQNHLEACFLEIGTSLRQYCDQAASYTPDEVTYLQSYAAAYVRCCLPYLKSCLVDGIYGNLLMPSAADEDMETLLVTYLPVMKKKENEEEEQEIVNDTAAEKSVEGSTEVEGDSVENNVDTTEEPRNETNLTIPAAETVDAEDIDVSNNESSNTSNQIEQPSAANDRESPVVNDKFKTEDISIEKAQISPENSNKIESLKQKTDNPDGGAAISHGPEADVDNESTAIKHSVTIDNNNDPSHDTPDEKEDSLIETKDTPVETDSNAAETKIMPEDDKATTQKNDEAQEEQPILTQKEEKTEEIATNNDAVTHENGQIGAEALPKDDKAIIETSKEEDEPPKEEASNTSEKNKKPNTQKAKHNNNNSKKKKKSRR
ncbi:uncharacterized protein ATC70_012070 [Mucor velutinosus]|uniref:Conserved oligomeric Golgi complex subunit 8 n=1 Tax=Mucor velutinosus TaxID=708070 RepID=A0AAN7DSC5_9FUNG|nr:hypothetical protein ATC70_012070 [Mucor velutinosus]